MAEGLSERLIRSMGVLYNDFGLPWLRRRDRGGAGGTRVLEGLLDN